MRPGEGSPKGQTRRKSQRHERDAAPWRVKRPGPTRTQKTMHHPATRIGEMRRGKS